MSHVGTDGDAADIWIAFEPAEAKTRASQGYGVNSDVKRKKVRAAAATSSSSKRLATMRRKREDEPGFRLQAPRSAAVTALIKNASMAGKAFETHLWTLMTHSQDLHSVAMFLGSTEAYMLGLAENGRHMRTTPLFLRGAALKCMHLTSMSLLDPAVEASHEATSSFAICLCALAGWDKIHGDPDGYAAHMKALKAVDQRENGTTARTPCDLDSYQDQEDADALDRRIFEVLHSVTSAIQTQSEEIGLLVSSDASLTIDPRFDTMQTVPGPVSTLDYSIYNLNRHDTRALLFMLNRVANLDLMSSIGWTAMYEPSILVMSWRLPNEPPSSWPGDLSSNDLEDLALYHIRAALVSIIVAWTYAIGVSRPVIRYFLASESADEHYQYCTLLETYPLLGTPFEEAALWSLFVITATADPGLWKQSTVDILRKLLRSPRNDIQTFEALETVLRKYAYRECVHRKNCQALWKAVMEDVGPGNDVGLRMLAITLEDLAI